VPGIIGRVGTICGSYDVNIAQMSVGRTAPGGDAIGVLNLDQKPSAEAIAAIEACPGIRSARVVTLPAAGQRPRWLPAAARTVRPAAASRA
jgi:D-3-phosphoglycerate dehydrogenase